MAVDMLKKCTPLWRKAHVHLKSVLLDGAAIVFEKKAQGTVQLVKSKQNVKVLKQFREKPASVADFKRICKDAFRVAIVVQETHEFRYVQKT